MGGPNECICTMINDLTLDLFADEDEILKQIRKTVVSSLDTVLNSIPIVKV